MKVTVFYDLDHESSMGQKIESIRNDMEQKIFDILTSPVPEEIINALPKIDIADKAITPLLQKDVKMKEALLLLNSGNMQADDFVKLSQTTFDPTKMGPMLLRGAYVEKLSVLAYINKVFETTITLQTPVLVKGESVPLIKLLAIYMQNTFDRDIAMATVSGKMGGLKDALGGSNRPTKNFTPPKSSPK